MSNTMLIANNCTVESGSFMGDQLCMLKTCYLFVENEPSLDHIIMSVSPGNQLHFLWEKFIQKYNIELIYDDWNPGDWESRFLAWNKWRNERVIEGRHFNKYVEMYLRIHGPQRQRALCGTERGLGRKNIYEYWWFGQEDCPDSPPRDVGEWDNHGVLTTYSFSDDLIDHPSRVPTRDVYISPHAKTQGNITFTHDFWSRVIHQLIDAGVTVTCGYNSWFAEDLNSHPLYKKHWGDYKQWMEQVCSHKLISSGNTGTGWLAAACGVPMITMEPPNSQMPDHRYRECGLRNIIEVVDTPNPEYVAQRIINEVQRCVVMTTGCYDILHAGHVRHLERSRALGTKLIVALNSDVSVKALKGTERPINPQNQRKAILEALRCVDEVKMFDGPNALDLIQEIRPDILTAGYGYELNDIVGKDLVEHWGGRAVVTCRGDARDHPSSTTKIVKRMKSADIIEVCCLGASASVNPLDKLRLLAEQLLSVKGLWGDIADLGACRGGTSFIMRKLAPEKKLHILDTWEGTPYDDPLCHHKKGEWCASLEECQKLVGNSELTNYIPGIFPETAAALDGTKFCFVYVDMDTEQATRDAIEFFWPRMVPGGKMLIDDYGWEPCAGVKKAVDDLVSGGEQRVILSLYACILEKW